MPAPLKVGSDGRPFEFDTSDLVNSVNLGTGTANTTTFLRGDGVWSNTLTDTFSVAKEINFTSVSTVTAGTRQILATTSGVELNTTTGTGFRLNVNGSVLVNLTASSLALQGSVRLDFGATGSISSSIRNIVGTSGGLAYNTPTGTSQDLQVAALTYLSVTSSGILLPTSQTPPTGSTTGIYRNGNDVGFNIATSAGYYFQVNGSSVGILDATRLDLTSTSGIKFNSATGTVTAANREIFGSSTGLNRNVPSGGTHVWQVNGSTAASLSSTQLTVNAANGICLASNSGTLTNNQREILAHSGGMSINTPGKLYVYLGNPAVSYYELTASGITFTTARVGTPQACTICKEDVSNNMRFNVEFNSNYYFGHNGTTTFLTLHYQLINNAATNGMYFNSSTGATTSSNRQIAGASTGMLYNVPSGLAHIWTVANTRFGMLDGSSNKNIFFGQSAGGSVTTAPNIIAIGTNAAAAITTSAASTDSVIIGSNAAQYATGLNRVIAIGAALTDATNFSTAGQHIIAIGSSNVLRKLTTGQSIIAIGRAAMAGAAVTCDTAIAIGYQAGNFLTSAGNSVFIGYQCGYSNGTNFLTGAGNIGIGTQCSYSVTSGTYNVGIGYLALYGNTTSSYNVGMGYYSGHSITGTECIAIGSAALGNGATHSGTGNICIGYQVGNAATSGAYNVAIGYQALLGLTTGSTNSALGRAAGSTITQGTNNISIGYASNNNVTTGNYNITIGDNIGVGSATGDRQMNIGGALTRDTSGNVSLAHGTTGGTNIFTTSSTTLTLGTSIKFIISTSQTPATSGATGTTGTIAWDANYIYVCTATDTWKRAAIATW